jgi:hypothetical protein
MKADKLVIGALALLVIASLVAFALMISSVLTNAVAVQQTSITVLTQQKSVNIVIPNNATGWYINYTVLYTNSSTAPKLFSSSMIFGNVPMINVTVIPSATSGTTNTTVIFNVTVQTNLKFGEIPVTVIVYEYLSNTLYSTQVLHFNFFVVPTNVQSILIAASHFNNFTAIGHVKFGNISIMNTNIPASILSIVKGSNSVQILFNDSFTGLVSFQSNVTPTEIIADGQKLTQVFYTLPSNMPLGTWDDIHGTIYIYADPSNVTVIYPNTTTTTATGSATISVGSSPSSTSSNYATQLSSFYEQHKTLILVTIAFIFIIIIAVVLIRR